MLIKIHYIFLHFILTVIILAAINLQLTKAQDKGTIVYSNSFESANDTVGIRAYGYIDFSNDVIRNSGDHSLYVSGGCIVPHAQFYAGPFNYDGYFKLRCQGKNLQIGGGIFIKAEGDQNNVVGININESRWTSYESGEMLFCPAGKRIIISVISGGIVPSAVLIDKVEIICVHAVSTPWVIRNSGTSHKLTDAAMLDSSIAIVVGEGSTMIKTTDAGLTWKNVSPAVYCYCYVDWYKVTFFDKQIGYAAGKSAIALTTDGGEYWNILNVKAGAEFTCINAGSPGYILAGDDSGYVYTSYDTSKTWTSERISTFPIRSIFFPAPGIIIGVSAYALTSHSFLVKPVSPTREWYEMSLGYFQGLGSEAFQGGVSDDGTIYIAGVEGDKYSAATIIKLGPPDSHWYSVGPKDVIGEFRGLSIPHLQEIYLASETIYPIPSIIYTCGSKGMIFKSAYTLSDWILLNTPTNQTLNSICFFDKDRGFAVGDSGTILYTATGGVSKKNNPPSVFHLTEPENEDTMAVTRSITFSWQESEDPNNDHIQYTLLISSDTCATWKSYGPATDTTSMQVQSPAQEPGRYFWTVIANDGMLATPAQEVYAFTIRSVSDIENRDNKVPESFVLYQNYPNPFNPSTAISYQLSAFSHVTLKVYDILGREIETLVNENRPAGKYNVVFNGEGISSGVYFYILRARGFTSVKKFILQK